MNANWNELHELADELGIERTLSILREVTDRDRSFSSVHPTINRERVGRVAYEAYRASINRTTDDTLPAWELADHETQLAFRDAGEAVSRSLSPSVERSCEG